MRLRDTLEKRVLVFDGAMGTMLQRRDLGPEDFGGKEGANDYLVLTRPDVVREVHAAYFEAGADVVETNTFGASRLKLDEYGLGDLTHELNVRAAQIAKEQARAFSSPGRERYVAGSLGPSGFLPSSSDPSLGAIGFDRLEAVYHEQAAALIEGGVDALICETAQDILELRAQVLACHRAMTEAARPVLLIAQPTLDVNGRMLLGTDIKGALTALEYLPVDVIGLNCSTGPAEMVDSVRYLAENSSKKISVIPNAGLPCNVDGCAVYDLPPDEFTRWIERFVTEMGVHIVGGCCGTTPEHIRALSEALTLVAPRRRIRRAPVPMLSSGMTAVALDQEPKPLLVGERLNAQGSRKVKQLLLSDDYEALVGIARDQVESGAHVLDVCTAMNERPDEAEQMRTLVARLSQHVPAPLMIDTTEPAVVEAALKAYPGRAIVNSVNLEKGGERLRTVLPLVARFGAAVVGMCIDEEGMAQTAERKLEVAQRLYEVATGTYGLPGDALVFDALTFTLATGEDEYRRSAVETLAGLRRIKERLPEARTCLGVSNVSFGLKGRGRKVLNSVFLYHAVEAGLDLAIVNPALVLPYAGIPADERAAAEDLVFARYDDALARYVAVFEGRLDDTATAAARGPDPSLPPEVQIHWKVVNRDGEGLEPLLEAAMERQGGPVEVLNRVLLPAMKEVGDKFGAGELILPFVLQSAEVMKRAVGHVERFLEKADAAVRGRVVLATVYGDVHDIGKNLVKTILSNNGFEVHDLGKQVPVHVIIDKAVEVGADAIGLSALLVSTSKQMAVCVQELHARGLQIPVLVGGAAINREFGRRITCVEPEQKRRYAHGVFYCKDAFEGLELMRSLTGPDRDALVAAELEAAAGSRSLSHREQMEQEARAVAAERKAQGVVVRSSTPVVERPPEPPFWGRREPLELPLEEVFGCIDQKSLFRLSWGARVRDPQEQKRILETEILPRFEAMKREALADGIVRLRALYGYWPAGADGDDLVVFDPADRSRELQRFHFPRQPGGDLLCLSDYFRPLEGGRPADVVAFTVVTAGREVVDAVERLNAEGKAAEAYYLHGFGMQLAEASAEWLNRRIVAELGLPPGTGLRYSPGYPACPDLSDQVRLFELLRPGDLGLTLTESHQIVPEASTSAVYVHHPAAVYFSLRGLR